jgi:polyisoprenoid-binding protein YceI
MSTVEGVTPNRTTWTIDPAHSDVAFAVKHLMIFWVRGWFADVKGTVVMDDSDPAKAEVDVVIDANSIDTREAHRDAHLKSPDFFDAQKFPQLAFKGTRVTDVRGDQFKLVGDLTILGVSREVTLDVTSEGRAKDPRGAERAGYSALARVNRKDFGLTWNQTLETGGLLVGDEVKISLDLELVKQ